MTHYQADLPASPHRNLPLLQLPSLTFRKNNSPCPSCYRTHLKPCSCCSQSMPGLRPPLINSLASRKPAKAPIISPQVNSQTLFCSGSLWIHSPFRNQSLVALHETFQKVGLSSSKIKWIPPQFETKRGAYYWVRTRASIFLIYLKVIS